MKKLILTSLLTLALAASASAAVPAGGVYLDKDGTPLTEAQQVPPSLKSHKMAPQNAAIQEAMAQLPHSTSTRIALTVTEDGSAANASVAQLRLYHSRPVCRRLCESLAVPAGETR